MTHPRAQAERKKLIDFSEALVVCTLYKFGIPPDEAETVEEISNLIQPFIMHLNGLREFLEDQIREGKYLCYTSDLLLPIDSNRAILQIAKNETSNMLIRAYELTPSGHANNLLPMVIDNARTIIQNNPTLQQCIAYKGTISSSLTGTYDVGSPEWRRQNASTAANIRHDMPGGSRDKQKQMRELWATGKYASRDICAEQESGALGMSISAARNALKNTPKPK